MVSWLVGWLFGWLVGWLIINFYILLLGSTSGVEGG